MAEYNPASGTGTLATGLYNIDWIYDEVAEHGTAFDPEPTTKEVVADVFGKAFMFFGCHLGMDLAEQSRRFIEGCAILSVDRNILKDCMINAEVDRPKVEPSSEVLLAELDDFLARFQLAP